MSTATFNDEFGRHVRIDSTPDGCRLTILQGVEAVAGIMLGADASVVANIFSGGKIAATVGMFGPRIFVSDGAGELVNYLPLAAAPASPQVPDNGKA